MREAIEELDAQGVADITEDPAGVFTVVSRRMQRDLRERGLKRDRDRRYRERNDGGSDGETTGDTTAKREEEVEEEVEDLERERIADFEARFWNPYGKKIDRKKCYRMWRRLTEGERKAIAEDIPHYVQHAHDPAFRKNPLTYLSGNNWLDERATTYADPAAKLVTYEGMLDAISKNGKNQSSTDDYERVPQKTGKPLWRLKSKKRL